MPQGYPEEWGSEDVNLWENVTADVYGDDGSAFSDDDMAQALFEAGFVSDEYSGDELSAVREAFFDYCIEEGYFVSDEDISEFWEAWREANGY